MSSGSEEASKRRRWRDEDLPFLLREKPVAVNFIVFYISVVCLVANVLVACPCCFLGNFTMCCPTCRMLPIILCFLACASLGVICVYQTRPILDPKFAEREVARFRAKQKLNELHDTSPIKNV